MKYAIISDIHANLEALQVVLEDIRILKCAHTACLGDIVGYGANPKECLDLIRGMDITTVKGNHDEYVAGDERPEGVNEAVARAIQWTRDQLTPDDRRWLRELDYVRVIAGFTVVHASLDVPHRWGYVFEKLEAEASFVHQRTQVCFCGHTHVPIVFSYGAAIRSATYSKFRVEPGMRHFVNVGSVGQPRDGCPKAAYAVYDLAQQTIELRRLDYPRGEAERKIRSRDI